MKKLIALLLALIMVIGLVNCSSKEAKAYAAADDVTLVYWSMWEAIEPQGIAIQKAIDAFTAETGIKVDAQFKGRDGIRQGIQAALDAGTTIDIFDEGVDRVLGNWGDYLLDLEEYVDASGYEETANVGAMNAVRDLSGGGLKAIPYQMSVYGWFYNPEIFAEAGVTELPATWDEFLGVCEKIKAAGYAPVTSDQSYFITTFGHHVARYGGMEAVADAVMNGNWENNDAMIKAAQDYEEMYKLGYFSELLPSNTWPNGQNVEFAMGDAAMYFNGSWFPNEVKSIVGEDYIWGCFAYPAVEGGVNDTSWNNLSFQVFVVNKKSAYPEEAFKLIEWLTKGEWDLKLSQESIGVPADSTNTEWPTQLVNVQPIIAGTEHRYVSGAGISSNADIKPILQDNLCLLAGGKLTAEEFIATMQAVSDAAK